MMFCGLTSGPPLESSGVSPRQRGSSRLNKSQRDSRFRHELTEAVNSAESELTAEAWVDSRRTKEQWVNISPRAVELVMKDGGRFRIGTDDPEAFVQAIELSKKSGS